MHSSFLTFQLSLVLFVSTGSVHANIPDSEPDWECLNDYDTEMVCSVFLKESESCSEFNLSLQIADRSPLTCSFEHVPPKPCRCKLYVPGFVIGERPVVTLSRGEKNFPKEYNTEKSIKPKRPTNLTVTQTNNGNFVITWDTSYREILDVFIQSLSTQLEYGVKRSGRYETINVTAGLQKYEIVGRHLQPDSDYVVKARVSTNYNENSRFSDYSEEYEFRTTSSIQEILKIIIPIVCVILIVFISTIFYCYIKVIRQWWEKIPSPKIAPIFVKPVAQLSPFQNNVSAVFLESSKWDPDKEKPWISPAQVDVSGNSFHSPEKSGDSALVIYAQTVEGSSSGNEVECELLEEYKSTEGVQLNKANTETPKEYGNDSGSSFSNRCYLGLNSSGSSFLKKSNTPSSHPTNESENSLHLNQDLVVDFDYGPCNDSPWSAQSTPCSTETGVNELLRNKLNQINNDVNLIMARTATFPQDVSTLVCEDIITTVDDGYQSFPSLDQNTWSSDHNTELEQNIYQTVAETSHHDINEQEHAQSLKSLCGPAINISPGIQIDCSYQRV